MGKYGNAQRQGIFKDCGLRKVMPTRVKSREIQSSLIIILLRREWIDFYEISGG